MLRTAKSFTEPVQANWCASGVRVSVWPTMAATLGPQFPAQQMKMSTRLTRVRADAGDAVVGCLYIQYFGALQNRSRALELSGHARRALAIPSSATNSPPCTTFRSNRSQVLTASCGSISRAPGMPQDWA